MLPHAERIGTTDFSTAFSQGRILRHPSMALRIYRRQAGVAAGGAQSSVAQTSAAQLSAAQLSAAQSSVARADSVADFAGRSRAAFAVSKKLGSAATRNRLRRRVREIYRLHPLRYASSLGGYDLIFMPTAGAVKASDSALQDAVDQLLSRAAHRSPRVRWTTAKVSEAESGGTPCATDCVGGSRHSAA